MDKKIQEKIENTPDEKCSPGLVKENYYKPHLLLVSGLCIILLVALIASIATGGFQDHECTVISPEAAGKIVVDTLNLYPPPGYSAHLVAVTPFKSFYSVEVLFGTDVMELFITKDGTVMFSNPMDVDEYRTFIKQETGVEEPVYVELNLTDEPTLGNASNTIVLVSDFSCPYCRVFENEQLDLILQDYVDTGKAKLVFKNYPVHPESGSDLAAEAAECAFAQGKFWEYSHVLYSQKDIVFNETNLVDFAKTVNLSIAQFSECLSSGRYTEEVAMDSREAVANGVTGTPSFIVNNRLYPGFMRDYEMFKQAVDERLGLPQLAVEVKQ